MAAKSRSNCRCGLRGRRWGSCGTALSMRLGRGYPCVRHRVGCRALHRFSKKARQRRERTQRRDRFRCRTRRAADRGVQHPDREFLNPHDESVHEAAGCRRASRPLDHLVEADRSPRPGMPRIDDRGLAANDCTMGLVEWSCTIGSASTRLSATSRPSRPNGTRANPPCPRNRGRIRCPTAVQSIGTRSAASTTPLSSRHANRLGLPALAARSQQLRRFLSQARSI